MTVSPGHHIFHLKTSASVEMERLGVSSIVRGWSETHEIVGGEASFFEDIYYIALFKGLSIRGGLHSDFGMPGVDLVVLTCCK